jgi:hypothetical protein
MIDGEIGEGKSALMSMRTGREGTPASGEAVGRAVGARLSWVNVYFTSQ